MRIAVIGAGRVGTAVAVLLGRAGHTIAAVSGRSGTIDRAAVYLPGVPVLAPAAAAAAAGADVVLIAVPDDAIGSVAEEVLPALQTQTWLGHLSGAARLGVLGPAPRRFCLHLLQTFPDVDAALERIGGCTAAITAEDEEGRMLADGLARDLGATPFPLADDAKPLYHAAAVFASNHVVATSAVAHDLFAASGVPDPLAAMAPLQRATLENVAAMGPDAALTGPAVRGDAGTVAANLEALSRVAPDAVPIYVVMCRSMCERSVRAGRLTEADHAAVEEVLARWT